MSSNNVEMLKEIHGLIRNALLSEVYTAPKPGLVDPEDNGSHMDMDVHSFELSSEAITPYLAEMFSIGLRGGDADKCFLEIRKIGLEAERAMLHATYGVNTHKGMIFTMGIILAAAGLAIYRRRSSQLYYIEPDKIGYCSGNVFKTEEIFQISCAMCSDVLRNELESSLLRAPLTHGERLYRMYGERGIRGQAIDGFPILCKTALPAIRYYSDEAKRCSGTSEITDVLLNSVRLSTLMTIISELDDSNVLSRSNHETLFWLKGEAASIVRNGAAMSMDGISSIRALNRECIRRNISPGGAADILAVAILLYSMEESELFPFSG